MNKKIWLFGATFLSFFGHQVLASACNSNDLECQKAQAMREAGIQSLATSSPVLREEKNNGYPVNVEQPKPYEIPTPMGDNVSSNADLKVAHQESTPETIDNDNYQASDETVSNNINRPMVNATIKSLNPERNSGAVPTIQPMGSAVNIPQPSSSIYR